MGGVQADPLCDLDIDYRHLEHPYPTLTHQSMLSLPITNTHSNIRDRSTHSPNRPRVQASSSQFDS